MHQKAGNVGELERYISKVSKIYQNLSYTLALYILCHYKSTILFSKNVYKFIRRIIVFDHLIYIICFTYHTYCLIHSYLFIFV